MNIREMLEKDEKSEVDTLPRGMLFSMISPIPGEAWAYLLEHTDGIVYPSGVLACFPDSELERMYARWKLERGDT